jgi:hypothetical protein
VANRAGLSVRAISCLECGSHRPCRLTRDRFAAALELTAEHGAETHQGAGAGEQVGQLGAAADQRGGGRSGIQQRAHQRPCGGGGPAAPGYDGDAGIGKSRLPAEAVAIGSGNGMPVLVDVAR